MVYIRLAAINALRYPRDTQTFIVARLDFGDHQAVGVVPGAAKLGDEMEASDEVGGRSQQVAQQLRVGKPVREPRKRLVISVRKAFNEPSRRLPRLFAVGRVSGHADETYSFSVRQHRENELLYAEEAPPDTPLPETPEIVHDAQETAPALAVPPDPSVSIAAMHAFGYIDADMLPLSKERALELMEHVGLAGQMKKKTGKYSRGMRQRLGLADVLIKNPEIIILDEPTSGIDPAGVQEFIELIRQLSRKEGLTVLFSSHHLDQVQKVCDRVGLFNSGKLVTLIDMSDLKDKHQELSDIYNHYMEEGGERHE